ncbi:hypothetical protein [Streptomyces sp. SID8499]|uniref:hypothetical protein n=1 Tax=Streptomyces sp. SID8499 TaxID=2706106 RepID=UPI0013CD7350|nr:hypothetical protein [Streptomyces sp. SID8499]NED31143.1 hypothetical protein [Streptomyces sp. SID8499]
MGVYSLQLEDGELEFKNSGTWVASDLPQPDPRWRVTDSNGHEHYSSDGPDRYPTLKSVAAEPYWCADCQDEHVDTWYECRICGEKIEPGTRIDSTPKWVSTGSRYYWNGEPISTERANEILAAVRQAQDKAARVTERPTIGSRVQLGGSAVTVMPTAENVPDHQVTVMHDGTGSMETVSLEQIRKIR